MEIKIDREFAAAYMAFYGANGRLIEANQKLDEFEESTPFEKRNDKRRREHSLEEKYREDLSRARSDYVKARDQLLTVLSLRMADFNYEDLRDLSMKDKRFDWVNK